MTAHLRPADGVEERRIVARYDMWNAPFVPKDLRASISGNGARQDGTAIGGRPATEFLENAAGRDEHAGERGGKEAPDHGNHFGKVGLRLATNASRPIQ